MKEPHPITRARERYGLSLTIGQLRALEARVCAKTLVRRMPAGDIHVIAWDGRWLIASVAPGSGYPRITTFMPPDYLNASTSRAWRKGHQSREKRGGRWRRGA